MASNRNTNGRTWTRESALTVVLLFSGACSCALTACNSFTNAISASFSGVTAGLEIKEASDQAFAAKVKDAEKSGDQQLIASAVYDLGHFYEVQGNRKKAKPQYERALKIYEKLFGADKDELLPVLDQLAYCCAGDEKYADAETHYKRALAIREKQKATPNPTLAENLRNIGEVCMREKKYPESEQAFKRALEINENILAKTPKDDPNNEGIRSTLYGYSQMLKEVNRADEGEKLEKRAYSLKVE